MKALELLDDSAALALEFEWLRAAVAPVSPYGERIFEGLRPFAAGEEPKAQARAQRIAAVSQRVPAERIDAVRGVLRDVPDATPAIARAAIGGALNDPSFLELRRFGVAIAHIDELLADDAPLENAAVRRLREMLDAGQDREDEFYLADAFDDSLAVARRELMQAQAELDSARGRESERAARELGRAELGEEFIVMRAEHSGPLPQGVRVMREAATYFLCTLEFGDAALDALRRRDHAATALAAAEESARARISDLVRNEAGGLEAAAAALGELDVLFAAAHFTRRFGCLPATIVDEPALAFEGARFLPLEAELATAGQTVRAAGDRAARRGRFDRSEYGRQKRGAAYLRLRGRLRRFRPARSRGACSARTLRSRCVARHRSRRAHGGAAVVIRPRGVGAQRTSDERRSQAAGVGRRVRPHDQPQRRQSAGCCTLGTPSRTRRLRACGDALGGRRRGRRRAPFCRARAARFPPARRRKSNRRSRRWPARWITGSRKSPATGRHAPTQSRWLPCSASSRSTSRRRVRRS